MLKLKQNIQKVSEKFLEFFRKNFELILGTLGMFWGKRWEIFGAFVVKFWLIPGYVTG